MTDVEVPFAASAGTPGVVMPMPVEIDMATAPEVRIHGIAALDSLDLGPLFLDMSMVRFIDAAGLGALVDLEMMSHGSHREIVLLDVPPTVRRVLRKAGLSGSFHQTTREP